jgi:hypothetical protein
MIFAQRHVAMFAGFNLIVLPIMGRLAWMAMLSLNTTGDIWLAVALSLVVTLVALGVNLWLCREASRAGAPRPLVYLFWGVTVLTFGVAIGFGAFSPVNLVMAVLGI